MWAKENMSQNQMWLPVLKLYLGLSQIPLNSKKDQPTHWLLFHPTGWGSKYYQNNGGFYQNYKRKNHVAMK